MTPVTTEQEQGTVFETENRPPVVPGDLKPFATRDNKRTAGGLAENKVALLAGAGIVIAIALFLFASKPTHNHAKPKQMGLSQTKGGGTGDSSTQDKSVSPIVDSASSSNPDEHTDLLGEDDVHRTAKHSPGSGLSKAHDDLPKGTTLGALPPFQPTQSTWQPPGYTASADSHNENSKTNSDGDSSLVFVQKLSNHSVSSSADNSDDVLGLPLPPGTRLRARLETSASTAVRAPVIAVIEYNYESNGVILVPAGSKCFGHIEQADRSGYVSVRFDSLYEPDGSSVGLDAVATDLDLHPLRGKVEGTNTGKNIAVRSLSGLGEVGALLAGRGGNFNQPFSETDLMRERVSNNIGISADQELSRLSLTQHIVVSVAANTPIYVVLDRGTRTASSGSGLGELAASKMRSSR